jgi:hypothetical protein
LKTSSANSSLPHSSLRDLGACHFSLITNHYGTDQLKYCKRIYTSGVWRKAPQKNKHTQVQVIASEYQPLSTFSYIPRILKKKENNSCIQFANVPIPNFLMGGAAQPNVHAFDFLLITNNLLPHSPPPPHPLFSGQAYAM